MDDLIERLEAAEQGSRELDYAFKALLEPRDDYWALRVAADWTTSLDAALALAERTTKGAYTLVNDYGGYNRAEINIPGGDTFKAIADTMPLALCAAICRALTTQGEPG
jgi:hypothetical protein